MKHFNLAAVGPQIFAGLIIDVFNVVWLPSIIAWEFLLVASIYFTSKDARIGALIGAVSSWVAVLFWLVDNTYLISNLSPIGGYPVGQAFSFLGSYPSTTITVLNLVGILVCASLAVVTHFSFYRNRD